MEPKVTLGPELAYAVFPTAMNPNSWGSNSVGYASRSSMSYSSQIYPMLAGASDVEA
jgi:hypothetical protein